MCILYTASNPLGTMSIIKTKNCETHNESHCAKLWCRGGASSDTCMDTLTIKQRKQHLNHPKCYYFKEEILPLEGDWEGLHGRNSIWAGILKDKQVLSGGKREVSTSRPGRQSEPIYRTLSTAVWTTGATGYGETGRGYSGCPAAGSSSSSPSPPGYLPGKILGTQTTKSIELTWCSVSFTLRDLQSRECKGTQKSQQTWHGTERVLQMPRSLGGLT